MEVNNNEIRLMMKKCRGKDKKYFDEKLFEVWPGGIQMQDDSSVGKDIKCCRSGRNWEWYYGCMDDCNDDYVSRVWWNDLNR